MLQGVPDVLCLGVRVCCCFLGFALLRGGLSGPAGAVLLVCLFVWSDGALRGVFVSAVELFPAQIRLV